MVCQYQFFGPLGRGTILLINRHLHDRNVVLRPCPRPQQASSQLRPDSADLRVPTITAIMICRNRRSRTTGHPGPRSWPESAAARQHAGRPAREIATGDPSPTRKRGVAQFLVWGSGKRGKSPQENRLEKRVVRAGAKSSAVNSRMSSIINTPKPAATMQSKLATAAAQAPE